MATRVKARGGERWRVGSAGFSQHSRERRDRIYLRFIRFIETFKERNGGNSPTHAEIAEGLDYSSTSVPWVGKIMRDMRAEGYLREYEFRRVRFIEVIGGGHYVGRKWGKLRPPLDR